MQVNQSFTFGDAVKAAAQMAGVELTQRTRITER
jgi:hypothetical protein